MQDKPISQSLRKRLRWSPLRGTTIRTQLIFAFGQVLVLATIIAVMGYVSLRSLQNVVRTNLQDAYQIRDLGLSIQNEFLLARQNESSLLTTWRTKGFDVYASVDVTANENHLAAAHTRLDEMERLAKSSNDASLQSLVEEINDLRPLLDAYSTAFQVTVTKIRDLSQSGGLEEQVNGELAGMAKALEPTSNTDLVFLLAKTQASKDAYLAHHQAADRNAFTTNINAFMAELRKTDSSSFKSDSMTASQMLVSAENVLFGFNKIVDLENDFNTNTSIFQSINNKINQSIGRISTKSNAGLNHANTRLQMINRQTILTLSLTAILALALGILAAFFLGRGIVLPLHQLSLAAEQMGTGQLDQRVEVSGSVELSSLADTFNSMADQLRQTLAGLEQRVAERTHALERRSTQLKVAAEVARDASSTREMDVLLNRAVNLIRDRYGFYHAGIFLSDLKNEYAILKAATGEAGRAMLQRNHKLKIGEMGIVGYVCSTGQPRISLDVGSDAVHFKNPLLPETRSEMGLPLKVGSQVIGVLDVQSTEPSAFDQDDITVLQTMADLLAIAIDNARLFQEAQDNLQRLEALYGHYSEEAWSRMAQANKVIGFQFDSAGIVPIKKESGNGNGKLHEEEEPATLKIPLKLRGQTIASLDIWTENGEKSYVDQALLTAIGDRISQAMESARLYEEARTMARNEQILSQVTAQFTRSLGLDALLQNTVRELGQLPHVTDVSIHLGIQENFS